MNKRELLASLLREGFSRNILNGFEKVPREKFMPKGFEMYAYDNKAYPLEEGATISQPYTIAYMLKLLELEHGQKILEIGSGSGYVLALLYEITKGQIFGLEISPTLAKKSKSTLRAIPNIEIIEGDGSKGILEKAPFDRILVSAASPDIPFNLCFQLKENGILVAPVKNSIYKINFDRGNQNIEEFKGFNFVPMRNKK